MIAADAGINSPLVAKSSTSFSVISWGKKRTQKKKKKKVIQRGVSRSGPAFDNLQNAERDKISSGPQFNTITLNKTWASLVHDQTL